ncbi:MAG: MBL fold metallo-hydrolase [Candidatus Omnitrophota bacterium]|jgi:glyoxylase-like metal-dependent hydrolase (beta-lactamase superfamily II)|nr:MAG: MBL fold metallo-hydrolase [Candidatus Omnitrophota bacterium]
MILERVVVGPYQTNCYLLAKGKGSEAIIIDPGSDADKIKNALIKHSLKPSLVINTHGHFDHIGCDSDFNVPIYVHKLDLPLLGSPEKNLSSLVSSHVAVNDEANALRDGQIIGVEGIKLEVIHTPGHTMGGVCLLVREPAAKKILFTGDTLFNCGIGRTDIAGSNPESLIESIKKRIFSLPDNIAIFPGHGPSSTIGHEKMHLDLDTL